MSPKCQRRILAFLMAMTLAAVCDSTAYSSHPREEAHLAIAAGHIYVVPRNGLFHKIEKNSGRIIWTSQVKYEGKPFRGGSYTEPVFVNGQFVTIETFGLRMLSVDCDTGSILTMLSEQQYKLHSGGTYSIYTPLLCEDLLVSGASSSVQAFGLEGRSQKWNMGYGTRDFVFLLGYFQKGDILFLLVESPIDKKLMNTAEMFLDESLTKFEMIELDCQTGKILNRFDKGLFIGSLGTDLERVHDVGEWRGKRLIIAAHGADSTVQGALLFAFDYAAKSASTLVKQLDPPPYAGERQYLWYEQKPVASGDAIFYTLRAEKAPAVLMAKSLMKGETLWKVEAEDIPWAAVGDKVLTSVEGIIFHRVICRNAHTGTVVWQKRLSPIWSNDSIHEMKVSGELLYVLTDAYLRALNVDSGEEVWKVQLRRSEDNEEEPEGNIWNKILDFF